MGTRHVAARSGKALARFVGATLAACSVERVAEAAARPRSELLSWKPDG